MGCSAPFVFQKLNSIMKKAFIYAFAVLLIGLCSGRQAAAQSGANILSIQGTLKKDNGRSVDDGTYPMTFKLYTSATGGTAIWTETQASVRLVGGLYSVSLGSVTPLTPAFDAPYWLGVTVGAEEEILPRTPLTAAPYALAVIGTAPAYFGDVKTSYQTADHAGWVLLDGRDKTTLSPAQQARATALGIGVNLPIDDGRVLAGTLTGQTLGPTTGAAAITIAQNNLPNINLTTPSGGGGHAHANFSLTTPNIRSDGSAGSAAAMIGPRPAGDIPGLIYNGSATLSGTASGGDHTHTLALNGGVAQVPLNVPPPAALVLNFFIYLGI
jgi:hypothetical protein